jgi:hypothetical protein
MWSEMSDDEALQRATTIIKENTELVTKQNLVGFDFVFLRDAFHDQSGITACGLGGPQDLAALPKPQKWR